MERENYEQKKKRILTAMADKELKESIIKDVNELKAMIKNSGNADPGLETEAWLFTFRGKFYLVKAGQGRKIEDAAAKMELNENQDTKIFYVCTNESMCPLPPLFIGRRDAEAVLLKNNQEVIDYIFKITNVRIKL